MIKRDELADLGSALNKARGDEPIFVIRAKDKLSATMVRMWAETAAMTGEHEPEKIEEARTLAAMMEDWRDANLGTYDDNAGDPGDHPGGAG